MANSRVMDAIAISLDERFIANMRDLRKARGLTQDQLARAAGLSTYRIADLEVGRRTVRLSEAITLAEALDVTLDELLGKAAA